MCVGLIAGLVGVTGPCAFNTVPQSMLVGLLTGAVSIISCRILEKLEVAKETRDFFVYF